MSRRETRTNVDIEALLIMQYTPNFENSSCDYSFVSTVAQEKQVNMLKSLQKGSKVQMCLQFSSNQASNLVHQE